MSNRHVFTDLKNVFSGSPGSFSLKSGKTLKPICEGLEFWGKMLELMQGQGMASYLRYPLGCIHRFQYRARLGSP
jgi:hypothetical protein